MIKMLTAKEYNLIRYACTAWTVICGIVEVFCTVRVFSGDVAFISALFAAVSVGLALVCMRLSKSRHVPTAITAFLIDAILSAIATAAVIVWTFAAVKITSADTLDKEWQKKKSAYTQSVIDAAARLDKAQAKYTACTQNAATGGFRDRSKIALGCRDLSVDPTAKIFQPTEEDPGPQKTATKAEVGHSWEDWLMGLGRAGTGAGFASILFLAIVGAVARMRGKVEMPLSNETGQSAETSLPLSPLEDVSPAPSEDVKSEVPGGVKWPDGPAGTSPNDLAQAMDQSKPVQTNGPTLAPKRSTTAICNGMYKLAPRTPKDWRLRDPNASDPKFRELGPVSDKEAEAIFRADPTEQDRLVKIILRNNGKMAPQPEKVESIMARRATG